MSSRSLQKLFEALAFILFVVTLAKLVVYTNKETMQ